MKKLLLPLSFSLAVLFSACSEKKEQTRDMLFLSDSTALQSNISSDTAAITQAAPEPEAPKATQVTPVPRKASTTKRAPSRQVSNPVQQPAPPAPVVDQTPSTASTGSGTDNTGTTTGTDNTTTVPDKKEGISKAAKGAVIGGVAGAAAGAILTKKGKGAIIGGVVGAAGGYILGRKQDKKDGRIE